MKQSDLHWLAGLLEGEGSFLKGPPSHPSTIGISLQMTDEDIVARVAVLMSTNYWFISSKNPRHKNSWKLYKRGFQARSLMILLQPLMGVRRQAQIEAALATPVRTRGDGPKLSLVQATEIHKRFIAGESAVALAEEFGVTKWSVYRIREGKRAS